MAQVLTLSPLFPDNIVLQLQVEAPIREKAWPEVRIKTSEDHKEYKTTADDLGKWKNMLQLRQGTILNNSL